MGRWSLGLPRADSKASVLGTVGTVIPGIEGCVVRRVAVGAGGARAEVGAR